MHGSLLGWWWGQKVLPWDTDIDVYVSIILQWGLVLPDILVQASLRGYYALPSGVLQYVDLLL